MRAKCLAQEHNTMSPARARTRSARSGVERANHEATVPPMPPLVLLIKFALSLIIFQVSFSFNLLVAIWRLLPEFWLPNIFSTRHGNQNGRSLERCLSTGNFTCSFKGRSSIVSHDKCYWLRPLVTALTGYQKNFRRVSLEALE